MIIAVDASGGEHAPHEIVKGAIKAAQEYEVDIALVGNKTMLHVLAGRYMKKLDISLVEASEVIEYNEPPMKAVRSKPNSPIVVGVELVKRGDAAAFVSAGNTGAVLCAALLYLKKVEGIDRPALCSVLDITSSEPALLIDAGANVDPRPNHLVQFAHLGSALFGHQSGLTEFLLFEYSRNFFALNHHIFPGFYQFRGQHIGHAFSGCFAVPPVPSVLAFVIKGKHGHPFFQLCAGHGTD